MLKKANSYHLTQEKENELSMHIKENIEISERRFDLSSGYRRLRS